MQSIRIAINVDYRDISALVCSKHASGTLEDRYTRAVGEAIAQAFDVREFLSNPNRIHELERLMWERDPNL